MGKKERGDKIMFIVKRRILHIFFLIPILMLGLFITPVCYAENPVNEMYGPVSGNDTLGKIVSQNYPASGLSAKQIMTGILRANPEAFIGGNIHFLLRGATLHLPAEKLISTIKQAAAEKLINDHYQYFRRGKTGNFKIIPLVDESDNSGDVALEKNVRSILSRSSKNDNESSKNESQTSADSKEEIKSTVDNAVQAKKSNVSNAIKDIELESLRIKVSQLEKILSGRELPKSTNANNDTSVELTSSLEKQKQKIDQLEQERENKNKQLEQLKVKITELESSLKEMSLSLADNTDNKLQTTSGDDKNGIVSRLRKQNKVLKEQLNSLQIKLNNKTKEVATLSAEIKASKQKISKLETKLIDSDKENEKLDQQIAAMEAKLAKIRQEPVRNVEGLGESTLGFGISPWVWLLPALFLLSILAYLFKRSFSQPKKVVVDDLDGDEQNLRNTETQLVDDNAEMIHQQKTAAVAAAIASAPDIISSANEVESVEASIKLDIGKAYLDMDMPDAAIEILQEAYEEGSEKQRLEAKTLLDKLVQQSV